MPDGSPKDPRIETNEHEDSGYNAMKALIICFSHSGNTRAMARHIQQEVGGDLLEIQPVDPYPNDYDTVVQQAKRELTSGFKPALKAAAAEIDGYDTLFLGSPNWWSTIAPPLQTFLSDHDLSGKTVVPFITHGGGGSGRCFSEIAALCPGATVLEGLAVFGGQARAGRSEVSVWLGRLGITT